MSVARTFPLCNLVAATSNVTIRVRLVSLSPLMLTKTSDLYARAWVVDNDGTSMELCFWQINELLHAQLTNLNNKVVLIEAVSVRPLPDSHLFGINYHGAVPSRDKKRTPHKGHFSSISEVANDNAFPAQANIPDTTTAYKSTTSASPTSNTWDSELMRPPELVHYHCLACDIMGGSHLPTCPMTGMPHPQLCASCGMLQRPVLDFCPKTGKTHV